MTSPEGGQKSMRFGRGGGGRVVVVNETARVAVILVIAHCIGHFCYGHLAPSCSSCPTSEAHMMEIFISLISVR